MLSELANKLDMEYGRKKSRRMARFLTQVTGRMELPFTMMGRIVGGIVWRRETKSSPWTY